MNNEKEGQLQYEIGFYNEGIISYPNLDVRIRYQNNLGQSLKSIHLVEGAKQQSRKFSIDKNTKSIQIKNVKV